MGLEQAPHWAIGFRERCLRSLRRQTSRVVNHQGCVKTFADSNVNFSSMLICELPKLITYIHLRAIQASDRVPQAPLQISFVTFVP